MLLLSFNTWKVGRVVEGARLEYVFALCVTRVRIPDLPIFAQNLYFFIIYYEIFYRKDCMN